MPRRLTTAHPQEAEIFALALGRDADAPTGSRDHVATCRTCGRRLAALSELAEAVALEHEIGQELERPPDAKGALPSAASAARRERLLNLAARSEAALEEADRILEVARDERADLAALARELAATGRGRLALLYAAQRGGIAASIPARALAFAEAIGDAASVEGPAEPGVQAVTSSSLRGEARLLASQALLNMGRLAEARDAVANARLEFGELAGDPFQRAVCDYFEASVLNYQGEYRKAERFLEASARTFAEYAQDHWVGRAEAVRASSLNQHGEPTRALAAYEAALVRLDPERDANAVAAALLNRGRCLAFLGRHDAARQGYAQALQVARRHGLDYLVYAVRQCLAELDVLRGDYEKALAALATLADEADRQGLVEDQILTRFSTAECLGRLGRKDEMIRALRDVGRRVAVTDLRGNPAWSELASRLDPGDVDVGLVAEVRRHLEARLDGFVVPFRAARRA